MLAFILPFLDQLFHGVYISSCKPCFNRVISRLLVSFHIRLIIFLLIISSSAWTWSVHVP